MPIEVGDALLSSQRVVNFDRGYQYVANRSLLTAKWTSGKTSCREREREGHIVCAWLSLSKEALSIGARRVEKERRAVASGVVEDGQRMRVVVKDIAGFVSGHI